MTTRILDTGEAYLSATEKSFVRMGAPAPASGRAMTFASWPALTSAALIAAGAGLAVAALIG